MIDRVNIKNDDPLAFFQASLRRRLGGNLQRLLLFGSRARGDGDDQSDYDLLIVVGKAGADVDSVIDETAGEALFRFGAVFSAFPIEAQVLERRKFSPFLINAKAEAVSL